MGYYKAGILGTRQLRRGVRTGAYSLVGASALVGAVGAGKPTLRKGASGKFVMEAQAKLGIPVDSLFGPKTETAVRTFQSRNGLKADGVVGPLTWSALDRTPTPSPVPVVLDVKPLLQEGTKGAAVIEAQHRLGISVDGIFGPKTEAAVKEFQAKHELKPDGIIGPLTWNAMQGNTAPAPPSPGAIAITQSPPAPILVTPTGNPVTAQDGTPQVAPPGTPPVIPAPAPSAEPGVLPYSDVPNVKPPAGKPGGDSGTLAMVGLGVAGALGLAAYASKRKKT